MHIKKIISQHRRDFRAMYACDKCGHEHEGLGYDDAHFHNNVVPDMPCPECGVKGSAVVRQTKYPEGMAV